MKRILIILLLAVAAFPAFAQMGTPIIYIGVTLAVLKYRMPNGHFETTLSDVQEAVKIMRLHTEDWGGAIRRG